MTEKYDESTKEVLRHQLGSLISKPTPKPKVSTYNRDVGYGDNYWSNNRSSNYQEDYSYLDGFTTGDSSIDDAQNAEYLIQKMELNPEEIQRIASTESVQTLIDIITLLLYR